MSARLDELQGEILFSLNKNDSPAIAVRSPQTLLGLQEQAVAKCISEEEYLANPELYERLEGPFNNMENCEFWSTDFCNYWKQTESCWTFVGSGLGDWAGEEVLCSCYRSGSETVGDCSWGCAFKSSLRQICDASEYVFRYEGEIPCAPQEAINIAEPTRYPLFYETPIFPEDPIQTGDEPFIWYDSLGGCPVSPLDRSCEGGFLPNEVYPCPAETDKDSSSSSKKDSSSSSEEDSSSSSEEDGSSSSEEDGSSSSEEDGSSSSEEDGSSSSEEDSSSSSEEDSSSSSEEDGSPTPQPTSSSSQKGSSSSSQSGDGGEPSSTSQPSSSSSKKDSSSSSEEDSSSSSEEDSSSSSQGGDGGEPSSTSQPSSSSSEEDSSSSSQSGDGGEPSSTSQPSSSSSKKDSSSSSEEDSSSSSEEDSSSSSQSGDGGEPSSTSQPSSSSSEEDSSSSSQSGDGGEPSSTSQPSSSSSEEDSSSSSEEDSSSSSDCSYGLEALLIPELNSNPDLEGFYYGQDDEEGFLIVSPYPVQIKYEKVGMSGLPISTDVFFEDQAVATLNFQPAHLGTLFALIYQGEVRCGILTEQDIQL